MKVKFRPFRPGNGTGMWYVSTALGFHGIVVRTPGGRWTFTGARTGFSTRQDAGRSLVAATAARIVNRAGRTVGGAVRA